MQSSQSVPSAALLARGDAEFGAMYEIDGYWRTRTINEAQFQGYTALRLICGKCGHITDYPFVLFSARALLGNPS